MSGARGVRALREVTFRLVCIRAQRGSNITADSCGSRSKSSWRVGPGTFAAGCYWTYTVLTFTNSLIPKSESSLP